MLIPKRAGHFDLLVARQRYFAEYLSAAADDGLVGEVAAPQLERQQHHENAAQQQRQPVAGLDVLQCGRVHDYWRQFAMAHQHLLLMLEMARELFGEIDRAVLSAGAADGHGQVAAVVGDETGQPAFHEIADIAKHVLCAGGVVEKFDHRGIAPGERSQHRVVVRVGQAAHIEHQVGIQRDAVLVAERLEQQRQARAIQFDELLDPGAQRIGVEFGGVDVMADVADLGEQFTLVADAFRQGAHAHR